MILNRPIIESLFWLVAAFASLCPGAESVWDCVKPAADEEPHFNYLRGDDSEPYRDVHSRGGVYPDVHEASHQINAALMNRWDFHGKRWYAVYVMRGRWAAIPEPPLTLADVAAAVPVSERGSAFQMYLVDQQRWWNNRPGYVLDEAVCYANEWEWDHTDHGLMRAREMNRYALVLLGLAEKCPGYDAGPLRRFVRWHVARVNGFKPAAPPLPSVDAVDTRSVLTPTAPAVESCPGGNCSSYGSGGGRLFWWRR